MRREERVRGHRPATPCCACLIFVCLSPRLSRLIPTKGSCTMRHDPAYVRQRGFLLILQQNVEFFTACFFVFFSFTCDVLLCTVTFRPFLPLWWWWLCDDCNVFSCDLGRLKDITENPGISFDLRRLQLFSKFLRIIGQNYSRISNFSLECVDGVFLFSPTSKKKKKVYGKHNSQVVQMPQAGLHWKRRLRCTQSCWYLT